ncbi:hypothetical protein D3C72_1706460 [compost metagenome]
MAVAVAKQAIAVERRRAGAVVDQQVAGRVVGEVFRRLCAGVAHAGQAVERVVLVTALAVSCVGQGVEVAVGAVGIIAAVQRLAVLADSMRLQTALIVVGVFTEQQALLALLFATLAEAVRGQP